MTPWAGTTPTFGGHGPSRNPLGDAREAVGWANPGDHSLRIRRWTAANAHDDGLVGRRGGPDRRRRNAARDGRDSGPRLATPQLRSPGRCFIAEGLEPVTKHGGDAFSALSRGEQSGQRRDEVLRPHRRSPTPPGAEARPGSWTDCAIASLADWSLMTWLTAGACPVLLTRPSRSWRLRESMSWDDGTRPTPVDVGRRLSGDRWTVA